MTYREKHPAHIHRVKLSKNRERKHQNRSRKTKKCSGGFEMVVLFFWLYPVILKEYQ